MITESDVILTKSKDDRFNLKCFLLLETGFSGIIENTPEQETRLRRRAIQDMNNLLIQKLISNRIEENSFMHEFLFKFEKLDRPDRKKFNDYLLNKIREFKL